MEIHHIAPQRSENLWINHLHQTIKVFKPVFQRGTSKHEGEPAGDKLDRRGYFGAPVFDPLRFVHDDKIRAQRFDNHGKITEYKFVVEDEEARLLPILGGTIRWRTANDLAFQTGEFRYLPCPLLFK